MDEAVRGYADSLEAEHRALFGRLHGLILRAQPEAAVRMSYGMPTYQAGRRRLYLGVWQHGVSVYGWDPQRDGGFLARHPRLKSGKGTIRLRPQDAAGIGDEEFLELFAGALAG